MTPDDYQAQRQLRGTQESVAAQLGQRGANLISPEWAQQKTENRSETAPKTIQ